MNHPTRVGLTLVGLCCLALSAHAAIPLQPQPDDAEAWTESRTMIGVLDDGSYLHAQLMLTNVGVGSQKGACKILYLRPGKKPISIAEKGGRDDWLFDATSESFTVNQCTARNARYGLVVTGTVKDLHVEMTFGKRARKTKLPRSRITVDDAFYEYELYIPWSPVKVTVTHGKGKPRVLKGRGFVDHSRSTTLPRELASRWIRFLGIEAGNEAIFRLRYPSAKRAPHGWFLSGTNPKATAWPKVRVEGLDTMPPTKTFEFSVLVGKARYTVAVEKTLYRYAPVEEMNALVAAMARPWVGRPVTKTYRAKLTTPDGKVHAGILEIANNYK